MFTVPSCDGSDGAPDNAAIPDRNHRQAPPATADTGAEAPLTDDYFRDVDRTWAAAKAARKHPVIAVADRYQIPCHTAAGHVARARRLSYTGETPSQP